MNFGEKIMNLRKQNGLSQEEFGNKIDVSRQAISKWETMQSQPEVNQIKRICQEFNVSAEYLLNDEVEKPNEIVKKTHSIKLKKIILIIVLTILSLYLLTSLYKLILLLIFKNKINKIEDYKEYSIYTEWILTDKRLGGITSFYSNEMYAEGVEYTETYRRENNTDILAGIKFVNKDTRDVYLLDYDESFDKYILNDEWDKDDENAEDIYNQTKIKERAQESFPENILVAAFNPKIKVYFKKGNLCIQERLTGADEPQNVTAKFDKETGMLVELESKSEDFEFSNQIVYDTNKYEGSDKESIINAFDLENYDYELQSKAYSEEM